MILKVGDSVKVVKVYLQAQDTLTVNNNYRVLKIKNDKFQIQVDNNKKRWYYNYNTMFEKIESLIAPSNNQLTLMDEFVNRLDQQPKDIDRLLKEFTVLIVNDLTL